MEWQTTLVPSQSAKSLPKMSFEMEEIQVIELRMMDKRKYYPLTLACSLSIRSMLYPFMLIKTRLQVQQGKEIYRGTYDAFVKILRNEGITGLYRGYWVSCLQLFPSVMYITSYERTRHALMETWKLTNTREISFLSGGVASLVGQTLAVPLDIVSQHLMMMGRQKEKEGGEAVQKKLQAEKEGGEAVQKKLQKLQKLHIPEQAKHSRFGRVTAIVDSIYKQQGTMGFYKGYFVSLLCFAPHSALWWWFYDVYTESLTLYSPVWVPRLLICTVAAPMTGVSAALITNPLDVIRTRIQVHGTPFRETVEMLWRNERWWMMTKGLSARLVQSVTFSFFIILGYETIKRWSLLDHYKDKVRW